MATTLLQRSLSSAKPLSLLLSTRSLSTISTKPSHHNDHKRNHEFLPPTDLIGSWRPARDPREAQANLAMLRRQYARQVRETRKRYIVEMELLRQEKMRKDEAKREEIRRRQEERKRSKAAAAEIRAAERKAFEEEFRRALVKERAEKLEYWKKKQEKIQAKKNEQKELLRRQSSGWVDEKELEKKIFGALVDQTIL